MLHDDQLRLFKSCCWGSIYTKRIFPTGCYIIQSCCFLVAGLENTGDGRKNKCSIGKRSDIIQAFNTYWQLSWRHGEELCRRQVSCRWTQLCLFFSQGFFFFFNLVAFSSKYLFLIFNCHDYLERCIVVMVFRLYCFSPRVTSFVLGWNDDRALDWLDYQFVPHFCLLFIASSMNPGCDISSRKRFSLCIV